MTKQEGLFIVDGRLMSCAFVVILSLVLVVRSVNFKMNWAQILGVKIVLDQETTINIVLQVHTLMNQIL